VGTAAVQLVRQADTTIFGTASTPEKLSTASELGCTHPIQYTEEDFVAEIQQLTDGAGIDLVLDGVGGETTAKSVFLPSVGLLFTEQRVGSPDHST
jgi:NADPH2:quinone reductase